MKNIVLVDPDLSDLVSFRRSGVLSVSYSPSLQSGGHSVTLCLISYQSYSMSLRRRTKAKMATGVKACRKAVTSIVGEVDSFLFSMEFSD